MIQMGIDGLVKAKRFAKVRDYKRMFEVLLGEYHIYAVTEAKPCDMMYKLIESAIINDDKKETYQILDSYEKYLRSMLDDKPEN